ncbi:MAG TPA: HD domain-containing protein [Polyangiaceae bacterium]
MKNPIFFRPEVIPEEGTEEFEDALDALVEWLEGAGVEVVDSESPEPEPNEPRRDCMAEETLKNPLTDQFTKALTLACDLHQTQPRKGTQIPYMCHILGVASLALEYGATEAEAIAAILHDAIEDQPRGDATRAQIRELGGEVLAIVEGCTQDKSLADGTEASWMLQREAYIKKLPSASSSIRLVSACDKLHNARAVLADYRVHGEALWTRFNGKRKTLWYYRALADAYAAAESTPSPLVAELNRVVRKLEKLAAAAHRPGEPA